MKETTFTLAELDEFINGQADYYKAAAEQAIEYGLFDYERQYRKQAEALANMYDLLHTIATMREGF